MADKIIHKYVAYDHFHRYKVTITVNRTNGKYKVNYKRTSNELVVPGNIRCGFTGHAIKEYSLDFEAEPTFDKIVDSVKNIEK